MLIIKIKEKLGKYSNSNLKFDDYSQWFTNDPPQSHRAHGGRTEKKPKKKSWDHTRVNF